MKPPAITEKQWLAQVKDLASLYGYEFFHPHLSLHSARGWPDCSLCRLNPDGTASLLFFELKSATGKPTADQLKWLDLLNHVPGILAMLVRPSDFDLVAEILRNMGKDTPATAKRQDSRARGLAGQNREEADDA